MRGRPEGGWGGWSDRLVLALPGGAAARQNVLLFQLGSARSGAGGGAAGSQEGKAENNVDAEKGGRSTVGTKTKHRFQEENSRMS